jgi:hypothetical protein
MRYLILISSSVCLAASVAAQGTVRTPDSESAKQRAPQQTVTSGALSLGVTGRRGGEYLSAP